MPDGCDERFEFEFIKYVWNFSRDKNPLLQKRVAAVCGDRETHRLKSQNDVRSFLSAFEIETRRAVGAY